MDYKDLYINQLNSHYCNARELQYSTIYNYFLDSNELKQFYDFIDNTNEDFSNSLIKLDLKTFNSKNIYFSRCIELSQSIMNYCNLLIEDLKLDNASLAIRNMSEIMKSRIYSEVEGSLNIENVPTTRKRFEELVVEDKKPVTTNDKVIKNMANAIEFVLKKPEFTKENLFKLYNILSKDSLDYDHRLHEGDFYRYDKVFVDAYEGCPFEEIGECMNSLFKYVNNHLKSQNYLQFFLPHIAHYYIVYIHPYFDFNGRTARMVSFWIYLLMNNPYPPYISDAINQTKGQYYAALSESRNARNDITYFLLYIMDISILYFLTYKNIEHIDSILKNKGTVLSNLDKDYIKRILVSANGNFMYTDFTHWNHIQITKQGAFKILNRFVEYGILNVVNTNNNKKLFCVNTNIILYQKKAKIISDSYF